MVVALSSLGSFSMRGTEKLYSSLQQEGSEEKTTWELLC